jgi:hypothetical protein
MREKNNKKKNKDQNWYKNKIKSNSTEWNFKKNYNNQKIENQIWYN